MRRLPCLLAFIATPALAGLGIPELPPAVMGALNAQWPGFVLGEAELEGANWEVEIKTSEGTSLEVLLSAAGAVLHFHDEADEQEIALDDLPAVVTAAVQAGWPGCTLLEAEREGSAYEVEIRGADSAHLEVLLQADGTVIASSAETPDEE